MYLWQGVWKMPTGLATQREDIGDAAEREVLVLPFFDIQLSKPVPLSRHTLTPQSVFVCQSIAQRCALLYRSLLRSGPDLQFGKFVNSLSIECNFPSCGCCPGAGGDRRAG